VFVSAASIWEIGIKQAQGKLEVRAHLLTVLREQGYLLLAIRAEHALRAAALPMHHRDPFDRMLVAQAQVEGLTLVTDDSEIARYDVSRMGAT